MPTFEFDITLRLPSDYPDPAGHFSVLREHGFQNAAFGDMLLGYIGIRFSREAESIRDARSMTVADVRKAIPGAKFVKHRETRYLAFPRAYGNCPIRSPATQRWRTLRLHAR